MRNIIAKLKNKNHKGQTALEYALVVVAISLVLMAAWNVVGKRVQEMITVNMLKTIEGHMTKGNATVGR
jgi:Flp pilus assembly pilin Flp